MTRPAVAATLVALARSWVPAQIAAEQRGEEEDGSHEAEHHRPGAREAGRPRRKALAEDEGDQRREEEPGWMEEDLYPQDPPEPDTSPIHQISFTGPCTVFHRLHSIRAPPCKSAHRSGADFHGRCEPCDLRIGFGWKRCHGPA